ncbi:hypothetical protein GCM10010129_63160 [Streptomyces fumigatiscleroticus]|nr:hypothetical protein GCM10010129_63160 [Streptomyces fumigatiscleroticus]
MNGIEILGQNLTTALTDVKAEIARTDNKCSLLLAFVGAVLAGAWTVAKDAPLNLASIVVGITGMALLVTAAGLLLASVRPRLSARDRVGFPLWATLTAEEIDAELSRDWRAQHIAALSRIGRQVHHPAAGGRPGPRRRRTAHHRGLDHGRGRRMIDTATAAGLDPATLADALRVAGSADFHRWQDQIKRTGGCADPIHLRGWLVHKDKTTGETLHHYTTESEPGGRLRVACGNRRASRCPACAWTYAGDTYHLMRAGLAGDPDKDIPATVRNHPRVFATFTPPSFGPVHNRPDRGTCRCGTRHAADDPVLGTALDPATYDYAGTVLFNNHAGELWMRFANRLRREIAARAGLTQRELHEVCRVTYGKVAEFQKRGGIHFHAVIRLDGPEGPDTPPPSWASTELLTSAIRAAARHSYSSVTVPAAGDQPARTFQWGRQLDVRPIKAFGDGTDLTEQAVASYVAKYATKAAESTGATDDPVYCRACRGTGRSRRYDRTGSALSRCATCHGIGLREDLAHLDVPDHARRLMAACAQLQPLYPGRPLARWAHMLGFRGHFSTKSRRYSTTLGALRQVRADFRAAQERQTLGLDDVELDTVLVLADWQYAGHGHTPGESALAASIARDLQINRETAREELSTLEGA